MLENARLCLTFIFSSNALSVRQRGIEPVNVLHPAFCKSSPES